MHMPLVKTNPLLEVVKTFFKKYYEPGKPLLLGYSGGYDSETLLHILLEVRKEYPFELHLAHVDHGWRKESFSQALALEEKAKKLKIPFHLKRLTEKNGEDEARGLRLLFFKTLFEKHHFQALLLAHQKNDLAETVFKRFLEGAHLPFLFGMEETGILEKMAIWRPLLSVTRSEILHYVQTNQLVAIDDETNRNTTYLRARMRQELLPKIEKSFGKSILDNLALASSRSSELKKYFDQKTQIAFENTIRGPLGMVVPALSFSSLQRLEVVHLLKRIFQENGLEIGRYNLDQMVSVLEHKKANFRLFTKEALFVVDRGNLFIQLEPFPIWEKELFLEEGIWTTGQWRISVTTVEERGDNRNSWIDFWCNRSLLYLPGGNLSLSLLQEGIVSSQHPFSVKVKSLWQSSKTPAFMRKHVPVVYRGKEIVGEFLSGRGLERGFSKRFWKIEINL